MKTDTPSPVLRMNYTPAPYRVSRTELEIHLDEKATRVFATLHIERQGDTGAALALDGENLILHDVKIDGLTLPPSAYEVSASHLIIKSPPTSRFRLETVVEINPKANTALSGLYMSDGMFCTQCEAEGFRRITYAYDRPDNMSTYAVSMIADRARFPILLSNGNPTGYAVLPGGRHKADWEDPFPKPSYLFALVAGDLSHTDDTFVTASGRRVKLGVYVTHGNKDKVDFAMGALKRSMKWDEEKFGREYDLDVFNIVAVSAFNFGAMENKGLNIFNDKLILARPETATDTDYDLIEAVIGHEYFHNWSGNRVTCRDWFQLSLKEGFTVFRDQAFSADMRSAAVERIGDVKTLRARQFQEDAGPLAHPIRPDQYLTIDNFYTATVYEKGAEVVRMLQTILGEKKFRTGCDLYFARHDGTAATCDDFVKAMEDASGVDLSQFRLWYSQAGTPVVRAAGHYDDKSKTYTLTLEQELSPTPGQQDKQPMHIPVAVGLVGQKTGSDLSISIDDSRQQKTHILNLRERKQAFTFKNVSEAVIPSIGRSFSAPAKFDSRLKPADHAFLMAKDSDPFNRWESGQKFATSLLVQLTANTLSNGRSAIDDTFVTAFSDLLADARKDPAFTAMAITLPSEMELAQSMELADPSAIHTARETLRKVLGEEFQGKLLELYNGLKSNEPYSPDANSAGRRALRNTCLRYITANNTQQGRSLAFEHFNAADNMTDKVAGLVTLLDDESTERTKALQHFYETWKANALVIDKWMTLQAQSCHPGTLDRVTELTKHVAFNIENPNRVRSLIGAFAMGNQLIFHASDGSGYAFLADQVLKLDAINPQVAARLSSAFETWRQFDKNRQSKIKDQLTRILGTATLSRNVREISEKTLG